MSDDMFAAIRRREAREAQERQEREAAEKAADQRERDAIFAKISAEVPRAIERLKSRDYPGARIIQHTNPGGHTTELAEWHVCDIDAHYVHRRAGTTSVAVRSNGTFMIYADDYDNSNVYEIGPINDLGRKLEPKELTAVFGALTQFGVTKYT